MNGLQTNGTNAYTAPGYARTRWAYTIECAFEYFIALLVANPFLTSLLTYLELDDATVGIIQSIISVAFLFQLASLLVVQRIANVKRVAATVHTVGQLFFLFLYLIPFLPLPEHYRATVVIGCLLVGYFGNYLVTSIIFRWGNSYVDPSHRARFAGTKEMISLVSGFAVTMVMGWVYDRFEKDVETAFLITAIVMAVVCGLDLLCLLLMKNRVTAPPKREDVLPFRQVVRVLFTNRSFVYVLIASILWQCAHYFLLGFMGTYELGELALGVGLAQIIKNSGVLARFALTRPIARYTDKKGYAKGLSLGITIAAAGFLVNIFTMPGLWWLIIIYTVLNGIANAGIGQNFLNISYSYVEEQYFVQASAIRNSVSGVFGFFAALAGGEILKAVQAVNPEAGGIEMFGTVIYGQQILSAISFVFAVAALLFIHFVLEKQKTIAK